MQCKLIQDITADPVLYVCLQSGTTMSFRYHLLGPHSWYTSNEDKSISTQNFQGVFLRVKQHHPWHQGRSSIPVLLVWLTHPFLGITIAAFEYFVLVFTELINSNIWLWTTNAHICKTSNIFNSTSRRYYNHMLVRRTQWDEMNLEEFSGWTHDAVFPNLLIKFHLSAGVTACLRSKFFVCLFSNIR